MFFLSRSPMPCLPVWVHLYFVSCWFADVFSSHGIHPVLPGLQQRGVNTLQTAMRTFDAFEAVCHTLQPEAA